MTRLAAAVDPAVLARLLAWTRGLEDIEDHHAVDGLYIGAALRPTGAPIDPEADFLVGLVIAFWFWFDDRSDRFQCGPATWDALIALGEGAESVADRSPEVRCFLDVAAELGRRAGHPGELRWWMNRSADVFRAMYAEEKLSRAGTVVAYAEALAIGADSTGLTSIVSAADLAHGLDRAARAADHRLNRIERHMCLSQRLLNDLYSAEKERAEGPVGRVSNLVLLLERSMPDARAFVAAEQRAHERMMLAHIDLLGPGDEFGALIRDGMANIRRWYEAGPRRYDTEPQEGPPA